MVVSNFGWVVRSKWANSRVPRVWLEQASNQPCPGKVLDGTGISIGPCGEKLIPWNLRMSHATKCRACQEWRNWQFNGGKVRCDCIAGKSPGRCKACAPVDFTARNRARNEAKRLKRKNDGGISLAEKKSNIRQKLKDAGVEPADDIIPGYVYMTAL